MTDLRTLAEAFSELESRAGTVPVRMPDLVTADRGVRARSVRLLVPAAAVAVVLAAAAPAAWQQLHPRTDIGTGTGRLATAGGTGSRPSAPSSAHVSRPPSVPRYRPPASVAALTARARTILTGIATIEVSQGAEPAQTHSGPAIGGSLTAAGQSGGFDLLVASAGPTERAQCDEGFACTVRTLTDGTTLAVGAFRDPQTPGAITYQVLAVHADGAAVQLHLSTERDPKRHSTVTASRIPLSVQQMTSFVTSDRW
ncbi:MAG: hypothetical protein ACR2N4_02215 [Jatrophihabitans sp.]